MNPDQTQLWQRIAAHSFDDPASACPFSLRLAKENGWLPRFTQRAIVEYRRFAFLAVAAGHPVSPSDAVDQVWHLHLLYTRDYWEEFCGQALRAPLHHGPTRGGAAEADKFGDWYARTLASYRKFFGEPPAEFWPAQPIHPRSRHVDIDRHWIIPKPDVRAWWQRIVQPQPALQPGPAAEARPVAIGSPAGVTAIAPLGLIWPFDLPGPEFLGFFVLLAIAVFTAAIVWRWKLRVPVDRAKPEELDPYEIAALAGGPPRAFFAALTSCVHRGWLELKIGQAARTHTPLPANLTLLERALCQAARPEGTSLKDVRAAATDALQSLGDGLAEKGLLMHGSAREEARWKPFLLALMVPVIGLIKIVIGLERERPIAILVFFTIVAFGGTLAFLLTPRRSRLGASVLDRLQSEHARTHTLHTSMLAGADAMWLVPLAVGLWGASALHATPLESVGTEWQRLNAATRSDGGGGCGSTCGGDGGGGGCGSGCGGGGCGGCGGGD